MTNPPASVTIGGETYDVPIGCKPFFDQDRDGTWLVYFPSLDGGMFIIEQLEPDSPECKLCAAVAAQHWRNKAKKLPALVFEDDNGIQHVCPERETQRRQFAESAAAWEALANDL